MHVHLDVLVNAGIFPIVTVGDPGVQGAGVFGMHGIGVKTPIAADVAEATAGLARDMHIPKGGMFIIGLLSMMVAAGAPAIVLLVGRIVRLPGAMPNEHIIMAPEV